jgi:hypothetical protein
MATYQGPNVQVNQQFKVTPTAIAIEDLPSVAVATAYDVYSNKVLGETFGIADNDLAWGANKVVFDETVVGARGYDFYPVRVYSESEFGDIQLNNDDLSIDGNNVTVDRDETFNVPNVGAAAGSSSAIIPYYKKLGAAGEVQILATDLDTVIVTGGAVVTAQIKPGQLVWITTDGGTSWTNVGTVGSIGNDETKVNLAAPYTAAITTGNGIVIGATSEALIDFSDTLYDPNANFVTDKVRVGDIIEYSSQSIFGTLVTPVEASVISIINNNTLRFNTEVLAAGSTDTVYEKYKASTEQPGSTIGVYEYTGKRLLGFSEDLHLKDSNAAAGVPIITPTTNTFSVLVAGTPALTAGDKFIVTTAGSGVTAPGVDARDTANIRVYTISTVVINGANYDITADETLFQSGPGSQVAIAAGDFLEVWTTKRESDVKSDFRAVRESELGVVHRITSTQDIVDLYSKDDDIVLQNELAFMLNIIFGLNGGKVLYAVNVDASAANLSAEYADALEELKLFDVYSHAFGTTDPGVNALVGPYVLEQADPYEAHERVGIITYDELDIYLQGIDTGTIADTGIITLNGAFNPITAGVTVNDTVDIYDGSGTFVERVNVIATPTVPTTVTTDYDGSTLAAHTFQFRTGRKEEQANKISEIDYGERRVKVIWPGWFSATYNGDAVTVPPYYVSAARVGLDNGVVVSQSQTNGTFSIPGLSNYSLNTSTYFRKAQLDTIGGGGVDIQIQDSSVSQSIRSRHDLTSNMDAIEFREWSITKQVDVAAKTFRNAINPYVGKYNITPDLFRFVGQILTIASSALTKEGIIVRAEIKSVRRDEVVVDRINVVITVTVFVAANYYNIDLIVVSQ